MNTFDKKYGIKTDNSTNDYHKSRRMFCIYNNELIIAKPNLPYSHAQWFEQQGWITQQDDTFMEETVRGYVDMEGNIYFYTGYDFRVDEEIEKTFFKYLDELIERLNLSRESIKIFGGSKREGGVWIARKEYNN